MQYHSIRVKKTAHYALSGNTNSKKLVIALHGYGQLVKYFIRKFQILEEDYLIAAPEALNYFYTNGFAGRVGASWMTKENREAEIVDYLNYIDQLLDTLTLEFPQIEEIHLLGFSQGTATASRYFAHTQRPIHRLILWSGLPAHDVTIDLLKERLLATANKKITLIQGESDEMRPDEIYKKALATFQEHQLLYSEIWYEGGHAIDTKTLKGVFP